MQNMIRRATGYRGEGDYRDYAKYLPRIVGGAFGGMTGGITGARAGWDAGADISKQVGWGDYGTGPVGNAIIDGAGGPPAGITVNASDDLTGDIYLSHREYVGTITASQSAGELSTTYKSVEYPLNAAMSETFPFLSQIASNYCMYEFQGLIFEYKPQCGEGANASNNLGKIMMVTQYDPDAPTFTNSVSLNNYDYACSTKPSLGLIHGVETARMQSSTNILYTRTGTSTKSKVFTDLGYLSVATEGIPFPPGSTQQTQVLGELWVTYRVKLSRAQLASTLGSTSTMDIFSNQLQIGSGVSWNSATALPQGLGLNSGKWAITAAAGSGTTSNITCTLSPAINYGFYRCDIYYTPPPGAGTDAATLFSGSLAGGTFTAIKQVAAGTTGGILCVQRNPGALAGSASMYMATVIIAVTSPSGSSTVLTWTLTGAGSAAAYVKLIFTEVSNNVQALASY